MSNKRVAIIGASMTEIGKHPEKTVQDLTAEVIKKAISEAKINKDDIDGVFTTPEGFTVRPIKMRTQRICEYFNLKTKSLGTIECGGISSMLAVKLAVNEILLGNNQINLVFSSEIEKYKMKDAEEIPQFLLQVNALYSPYDSPYGILAATPYYAMGTQRYMYEYKISSSEIAQVAVVLRENAGKNPYAQFRTPITVADVLNSRMVVPPIHLLEACPMGDGAAAIVLASEEKVKELKIEKPVYITGIGEYHDSSHFTVSYKNITDYFPASEATKMALKKAGKEISDIDVAEIYGVFAGTELMLYESIGFFEKGKAAKAVAEGLTKINGKIPINPSGGRLSVGHPPYVTPLLETIEIVYQLRGEAGEKQVKEAKVGLVHAEHGSVNGSIVMILENS